MMEFLTTSDANHFSVSGQEPRVLVHDYGEKEHSLSFIGLSLITCSMAHQLHTACSTRSRSNWEDNK